MFEEAGARAGAYEINPPDDVTIGADVEDDGFGCGTTGITVGSSIQVDGGSWIGKV